MYTTLTIESDVTQERKLEIQLPDDAPLGKVSITVIFIPDELNDDSEPDESVWHRLLTMPDRLAAFGPVDLADRHDDYLYGDL